MFTLCISIVIRNYTTTSVIVGAILYSVRTVIQSCTASQRTVSAAWNVQQNPLCAASCVTKDASIPPRFSPTIFCHRALYSAQTVCSVQQYILHRCPNDTVLKVLLSIEKHVTLLGFRRRTNPHSCSRRAASL